MPAKPEHYQIPGYGQAQPTQIVKAGGGPTTLVNNDTTITVYFDDNIGVNPTRSTTAFLPPQASTSVDGKTDVFAICAANQEADFLTFPGLVPWQNPVGVQIALNALGLAKDSSVQATTSAVNNPSFGPAKDTTVATVATNTTGVAKDTSVTGLNTGIPNNIAATGVPLLTKSTLIKNQPAFSQAPGVSTNSGIIPISQIGYEVFLNIYAAGNFLSSYHFRLSWFDSASGFQTGQEDYWFVPGSAVGSPHTIIGSGPTKGDQLIITSEVPTDSSVSVTISYAILENSRVYSEDNFETIVFNPAGVAAAAADMTAGILAASGFSVPVTGSSRLMPFFNGDVSIWANTASGTSDLDIQIIAFAENLQVNGTVPTIFEEQTNSKGFFYAPSVALPASQCQIQFGNNNASAKTCSITVVKNVQR